MNGRCRRTDRERTRSSRRGTESAEFIRARSIGDGVFGDVLDGPRGVVRAEAEADEVVCGGVDAEDVELAAFEVGDAAGEL